MDKRTSATELAVAHTAFNTCRNIERVHGAVMLQIITSELKSHIPQKPVCHPTSTFKPIINGWFSKRLTARRNILACQQCLKKDDNPSFKE